MKICYVCPDPGVRLDKPNGSSAHVRNIIRCWTLLGHDILLVTPASNSKADLGIPMLLIPGVEIFEPLYTEMQDRVQKNPAPEQWTKLRVVRALRHLWNNVWLERTLREAVSGFRPDFIYERYSPFCIAGAVMAKQMEIPHILEVNAPLAWEGTQYRKQALREAAETIEELVFEFSSHITTTCQGLKDDFIANGVAPEKITVSPTGVDTELFTPDGPTRRQGLEEKIVIGFVGSLKSWHGLEFLIEAFRQLALQDSRFHLLIVGDGPLADTIQTLLQEFPTQVTLVGDVPQFEVPNYLRAMDIAVAPYPPLERFYFSPLKIFEYMATGRAVVASRIGQIMELIEDGKTGLLVPPGDAKSLAQALQKLSQNKNLRQSLGANAVLEVRQKHTWMHRASMIAQLAKKTIGAASSSSSIAAAVPT